MENAEEELKRKLGWGFFFSRCRGKMQKEYKQSGTWGTKIIQGILFVAKGTAVSYNG